MVILRGGSSGPQASPAPDPTLKAKNLRALLQRLVTTSLARARTGYRPPDLSNTALCSGCGAQQLRGHPTHTVAQQAVPCLALPPERKEESRPPHLTTGTSWQLQPEQRAAASPGSAPRTTKGRRDLGPPDDSCWERAIGKPAVSTRWQDEVEPRKIDVFHM